MALRFVLGRAGSGKSHFCLEEIRARLREDPGGPGLFLLVPEQASYQMELRLAGTPDLGGMLRAQVLSFRRLGWRVLSECGGGLGAALGEMGKRMVLRRILLQKQGELSVLAPSAKRQGMADLLARTIAGCKAYRLKPEDLERTAEAASGKLAEKLKDLALIFGEYEQTLSRGLRDPDDALVLVSAKLAQMPGLRQAEVWLDGFKGFTPQELMVIEQLLRVCSRMTVSLPLEPGLLGGEGPAPAQELFSTPWQTYLALQRIALAQGTEILAAVHLFGGRRFKGPILKHVEQYYTSYPAHVYVQPDGGPGQREIRIATAPNRRAEVEGAAGEILRLARDEGLHWDEMALLTRDMSGYARMIEDVFREYNIPLFLDQKRNVAHHPLPEFIQSALEIVRSDWNFEAVFRCLKTGFFPLSRDAVDCLENYCLERGISGRRWFEDREWPSPPSGTDPEGTVQVERADDEVSAHIAQVERAENEVSAHMAEIERADNVASARIAGARQTVLGSLARFYEHLSGEEPLTVRRLAEEVYALLEEMEIPDQLAQRAALSQTCGRIEEGQLQLQMWEGVLNVLDEMVAGLGEECLSLEDFAQILASGTENLQLGLIPPTLDQVLAGALERSRNPEVRVLFLLGANEGVLPARPQEHGIFVESEREELARYGLELAPSGQVRWADEQFFLYSALTRAGEQVVLSYSLSDEDGKGMLAAPIVKRLQSMFPFLREELWEQQQEGPEDIGRAQPLFRTYALKLGEAGGELPPFWQAAKRWFLSQPEWAPLAGMLEAGKPERRKEENLPRDLARSLYGRKLRLSVSRLEMFNGCPFAHFAGYGLRLRERSVHRLAGPDLGQFFHRLLHDFARTVRREGLDWGRLSQEESRQILGRLTDLAAPDLQHEILLSSARYRFLTRRLQKTVHRAVLVLAEHARRGRFVPVSLELPFGEAGLPTTEIPLSGNNSLRLVGQIDRVDAACLEGKVYLRVLDYKSHEQVLSLERVYHGLNIQLVTYLDAALQGAEVLLRRAGEILGPEAAQAAEVLPAGFLYFPVIDPMLDNELPLPDGELEERRLKAIKVDGYLLADQAVLQAMDRRLAEGESELLRLKMNKDGSLRQGSKVLSSEEFALLCTHLGRVVREGGERILAGEIGIRPFKLGQATACRYCSYRPVCHFEEGYRNLPKLGNAEIWQRLRDQTAVEEPGPGQPASSAAEEPSPGQPASADAEELFWLGETRE
ncbi:ATP-dependent helicase/deoxyribonuclease subunit B [Peptococcaceae bacterium CEB3]|nr:ATP-dependent helicase/deoxyribonuclease subunit B [Peptococcaceae bacterium CEB3]